jgi:membrane-bound ClpP family serine protease
MRALLFSVFLTLGFLFTFIAIYSSKKRGFEVAFLLGMLFLYLALIFR